MSNTIKLKRGSGSDPSASDLVVGEVALRTDSGKLFTKKDDNSVSEIGGGSGAIDDGAITNAKVASDAAIAGSKISPVFTSNTTIQNTHPKLFLTDTNSNSDFSVENVNGVFTVVDQTNTANRLQIASDGTVDIAGNLDANGGLDVTGALNVNNSGSSTSIRIENGNADFLIQAGDTGSDGLHFYDMDNTSYRMTIANDGNIGIGDTSPSEKLDVAGNIAVTGTVDGRDLATDGTKLDGIESNATADQSNSEIKTAYEANSDTNAFTDALLSKLNGIAASATNVTNNNQLTNGAGYITATLTNEQVQDIVGGMVSSNTESGITVTYQDSDGTIDFSVASQTDQNFTTTLKNKLDGIASGATNVTNNNQLTNGAGYITSADGGNAATVDGIDSSQFLRSDTGDTASGDITFSGGAGAVTIGGNSDIRFTNGNWTGESCKIQQHGDSLYLQGGSHGTYSIILRTSDGNDRLRLKSNGHVSVASGNVEFASGAGIDFSNVSDSGRSVTSNLLADYEEGSWSPQLYGGSNQASGYSIQDGHYVKVGSSVTVSFGIEITGKGSMSGDLRVINLPFDVDNQLTGTSLEASGICGYWKHVSPNSSHITLVADQDNSLYLRHTVGAEDDPDQMQASDIDSDFTVRGTITYFTNQ